MTDFGRDIWCIDSLKTGRCATGLQLLGQRLYHRLITPRGMLRGGEDEANFGYDLASEIGSTAASLSIVQGKVVQEIQADPEVESAECTIEEVRSGGDVSWTVTVSVQSAQGPFDLVLAVDDVTVELIGLRAA